MSLFAILLVGALCLLLSAALSGMETGLYGLQRVRLEVRAASGDSVARRLLDLLSRPGLTVATILILNNAVNYGVAWSSGSTLAVLAGEGLSDVTLELLATLYVTPILFIAGELLPKTLFMRYPARLVAAVLPLYRFLALLVRPLVLPLVRILGKEAEVARTSGALFARSGVLEVLTEGDESAGLDPNQREAARQVLALRALLARDAMLPWSGVARVAEAATREEVIRVTARTNHKRLMVVGEGPDRFVNAMDAVFDEGEDFSVAGHAHEVPTVAPDTPLVAVLAHLQRARSPIAVVRGPEGERLGLLTMAEVSGSILGLTGPRSKAVPVARGPGSG